MAESYPRSYSEYVLLERLGSGGMSEVDLARKVVDDRSFVRFTVIKRIKADRSTDESFVRMFKDEARITSELHHANIGAVYDFGKVDDEYYLALEYVPGMDVRYLVNVLRERGQRVPLKVALRIIADVLVALDYAHGKKDTFGRRMGIVHRDVNPRNVMMSIRGEIKLIDFGVAKATDRLEKTRTDHVKGKFSYMAPEQISGLAVDQRADLYAVGLMLHELLTGASPFFGLNQVQILHRMVSGKVPELPEVSELADTSGLKRLHQKILAHAPADRYTHASEVLKDLSRVGEELGGLPNQDQIAAFLNAVDPELTARLQLKMEAYAHVEITETGEIASPAALVAASTGGDLSLADLNGTIADPPSLTVTRTGMLAGSFLLVSMVSAIGAATIVVLGMFGVVWVFGMPGSGPPIEPPPVSVAPAPAAPAAPIAVPVAAPVTSPDPEPPLPSPVRPVRPGGTRPQPREIEPAPQPIPDPIPDPLPAPVLVGPDPAPVVTPAPEPVVSPAPAPAPLDIGFLSVTATEKGREVRVDGVQVGVTALDRFRVPIGSHSIEVPGYTCSPRIADVKKNVVTLVSCR